MTGIYIWEILPHKYGLGSEGKTKVDAIQLLQAYHYIPKPLRRAVIVA